MQAEAIPMTTATYSGPLPAAPPAHLAPDAADAWRTLAARMPWLTSADAPLLEGAALLSTREGPEWRALLEETLGMLTPTVGSA
jgi:hypothetical protein